MSFFGGIRLIVDGWARPAPEPVDGSLAPIRPGAWAEWAQAAAPATDEVRAAWAEWERASTFAEVFDGEPGDTGPLTDGRWGRVAARTSLRAGSARTTWPGGGASGARRAR